MYIFMEYCDEGTLEEVSRLGLQEHVIRLYSKQITVAINVLHEHGIVHRDIKGNPLPRPPWATQASGPQHEVGAPRTLVPTPRASPLGKNSFKYPSTEKPVLRNEVEHISTFE